MAQDNFPFFFNIGEVSFFCLFLFQVVDCDVTSFFFCKCWQAVKNYFSDTAIKQAVQHFTVFKAQ